MESNKKILVLNSGSSSLKYKVFTFDNMTPLCEGLVERIGLDVSIISHAKFEGDKENKCKLNKPLKNHTEALKEVLILLNDAEKGVIKSAEEIVAIGHRVVHGLDKYDKPSLITPQLIKDIDEFSFLAPLHNPPNLAGVKTAIELFPKAVQVAIFDTAFHQTMPQRAYRYAIQSKFYDQHKIRAYGFHGTSHLYITKALAQHLGKPQEQTSLICCHLGNGCSMSAVRDGKCVDTTMGLSPLDGLMMGSRCGQIDPTVVLFMSGTLKMTAKEIDQVLNKESGLKGVSGHMDLRDVISGAEKGDKDCKLALEIYCYKIQKFIGSYLTLVPNIDGIVFTAGVGENSDLIRDRCTAELKHLGIEVDPAKNQKREKGIRDISKAESKIKVYVIPTNEELEICTQTKDIFTHSK